MVLAIEDYAIIGDCKTAALVGHASSIVLRGAARDVREWPLANCPPGAKTLKPATLLSERRTRRNANDARRIAQGDRLGARAGHRYAVAAFGKPWSQLN